ncbi:MAG: peptidoglycan-associated lipoprotein Pal [Bdellovibrionales bacterium]
MLKRYSSVAALVAATFLVISCATKKPATEAPNAGGTGAESGKMDSNIASTDLSFDSTGSDSGKINGLHTIHFDYDSSTLTSETRKQLSENADWIKANPKVTVQIEGHCDSRGSVEYNLALGERRAKAVKNYMTSLGLDSKRMTIISYGEEKPVASGDNEEAYAKNRRANFVPLAQ